MDINPQVKWMISITVLKSDELISDQAEWEIWYQDTFDQDCPRQLELSGIGLVNGLVELWVRHLYETVQPNGFLGFSCFNLWWKQQGCSITITGEAAGQVRIKKWVFGKRRLSHSTYLEIADNDLLKLIAETHARLILQDRKSEEIVLIAHLLSDRDNFATEIGRLLKSK